MYGNIDGYIYAEEYLNCVLALATTGIELSDVVTLVRQNGIYHVAYQRLLDVLQTVGVEWEYIMDDDDDDDDDNNDPNRRTRTRTRKISKQLKDQNICLSVLDQIQIRNDHNKNKNDASEDMMMMIKTTPPQVPMIPPQESAIPPKNDPIDTTEIMVTTTTSTDHIEGAADNEMGDKSNTTKPMESNDQNNDVPITTENNIIIQRKNRKWWEFWKMGSNKNNTSNMNGNTINNNNNNNNNDMNNNYNDADGTSIVTRNNDTSNIGSSSSSSRNTDADVRNGILLSNSIPTMTQQLNVLSNIVLRVLLFGGDQELLVVAETLRHDVPIFQQRWYPSTTIRNDNQNTKQSNVSCPGVDYIHCMILLLRNCYNTGVVSDFDPPIPLSSSFANAYERLVATAVELGSGYLKPVPYLLQQQQQSNGVNTADSVTLTNGTAGISGRSSSSTSTTTIPTNTMESNIGYVASIPKPRTAQEEFGRFALLESNFRQAQQLTSPSSPAIYSPYPMDLVGEWEVRDEISGEIIGNSVVTLLENGNVQVPPPLEGLRWRLDPGPTHLDTCTFQVLSTIDRTILQYRGFIDRGARLEARFSKRPIRIRGSVMFQMREGGSIDYYKDMLPINYRTGTTKFIMTKITK
jgi:hypothetical protein